MFLRSRSFNCLSDFNHNIWYLLAPFRSLHIVFYRFQTGLLEQWIENDFSGLVNPLGLGCGAAEVLIVTYDQQIVHPAPGALVNAADHLQAV